MPQQSSTRGFGGILWLGVHHPARKDLPLFYGDLKCILQCIAETVAMKDDAGMDALLSVWFPEESVDDYIHVGKKLFIEHFSTRLCLDSPTLFASQREQMLAVWDSSVSLLIQG